MEDVGVGATRCRGTEEFLGERRLPDAGLAGDEDELALALAGSSESFVKPAQLGLPPDERDTGLDARCCCRERR